MISPDQRGLVREALRALGKERLVLGIHDAAFPPGRGDLDAGRGTPYGHGGRELLALAARAGFHGLQLGPQGETSPVNASPYDATCFSRSVLSIALAPLVEEEPWRDVLTRADAEALVAGPRARPGRADHAAARRALTSAVALVHDRLRALREARAPAGQALAARLDRFARESGAWLERDATFEALQAELGFDPAAWPAVDAREVAARHAALVERYRLGQLLVAEQHRRFRQEARDLGLCLLADLQVGVSARDAWGHPGAFVPGYLLGAPPSRTNPEGQPWGYPVLDPLAPAARALLAARVGKLLDEADGLRIDHPHGLVSPWVYRAGAADPLRAVQGGARLRASPDVAEHPELARWAVAGPDQLDRTLPRHADGWVWTLTPAQVDEYAVLLDAVVETLRGRGLGPRDLACEVLSTCPFPLREALARHGLGRFRVTSKANVLDAGDPYLGERAAPGDWIMLTTHDTPTIWALVRRWHGTREGELRAAYLARRLAPDAAGADGLARRLAADPPLLAHAMLAEALESPAASASVYFTDLLGFEEPYNVPGTVNDDNWTLRAPADVERVYAERCARGEALSLPRALALALRARGGAELAQLAGRLEALGAPPT